MAQSSPDASQSVLGYEALQSGRSPSSSNASDPSPEIFIRTVDSDSDSDDERVFGMQRTYLFGGICVATWVSIGVLATMYVGHPDERRDFISAIYMLVQITTTVGYGDVCPQSGQMKIFMSLYVFTGNIFAGLLISDAVQYIVNRSHNILRVSMFTGVQMVRANTEPLDAEVVRKKHKQLKREEQQHGRSQLPRVAYAFTVYVAFILIGTLYYGVYDTCACAECDATDAVWCEGGRQRNLADGLYMSVITLTTVGFGDEAPISQEGRLFCTFWMLFGVAAMANFISELAHHMVINDMTHLADHGMHHELFHKIDRDGNGSLSRFEFVTYMLVKYGLVSEGDLDTILEEFDKMDRDHNGELTYTDLGWSAGRSSCA